MLKIVIAGVVVVVVVGVAEFLTSYPTLAASPALVVTMKTPSLRLRAKWLRQ